MKIIKLNLVALFCSLLLLNGCDMDILNQDPTDQLSDVSVWSDPGLIDLFLADIYRGMHHGNDEVKLSSLADDSHFIHGYGTPDVVQGNMSPSSMTVWNRGDLQHYRWGHVYDQIRKTNQLLENLEESELDDPILEQIEGEAYFLRAWFYHNLLRMYGGVPIVDATYELDDDMRVARNSFSETVDFIVADTERAAELLDLEPRDLGRATRGAALALKSRVLIHAASDLFDNPQGSNPELTGYTSGSQEERYLAAREAAQDVIDLGVYALYEEHDDPAYNYEQLFITDSDHTEGILSRFFVSDRDWSDRNVHGQFNGPNGYRNWAGNTPIQNLVDAYEMIDGEPFDWNNPDHASAPYEDRDPRFYASILHDGAPWVDPPDFRQPYDADGIIQTFQSVTLPDGSSVPGVDTRNGPIEDWNGSYSGYYLRKFVDPSLRHDVEVQAVPWRFLRYGEVLLNYAEASLGLGDEDEARRVINLIRNRAGMPDITDTGDELVERYRNERRVELAFEEHRFFDIRRWMIAPEVMTDAGGITITAEATDSRVRSTYSNFSYDNSLRVQSRSWNDSHYFLPIPHAEMGRNELLIQNPGY